MNETLYRIGETGLKYLEYSMEEVEENSLISLQILSESIEGILRLSLANHSETESFENTLVRKIDGWEKLINAYQEEVSRSQKLSIHGIYINSLTSFIVFRQQHGFQENTVFYENIISSMKTISRLDNLSWPSKELFAVQDIGKFVVPGLLAELSLGNYKNLMSKNMTFLGTPQYFYKVLSKVCSEAVEVASCGKRSYLNKLKGHVLRLNKCWFKGEFDKSFITFPFYTLVWLNLVYLRMLNNSSGVQEALNEIKKATV